MLLVIIKAKKLLERFIIKNLKQKNQIEFSVEKVIARKRDKLNIKWKCCDNFFFNSWIDKKETV